MTGTATHRPLDEPFSTGTSWLARAVAVSFILHVATAAMWYALSKKGEREVELVDIEVAPAPPKAEALPAETAKRPEQTAAASSGTENQPDEPNEDEQATVDAGIDAAVDAPGDAPRKKKPDASIDAEVPLVAEAEDAGVGDAGVGDGGQVAMIDPGTGVGVGSGSQDVVGVPGATEGSQGSGV